MGFVQKQIGLILLLAMVVIGLFTYDNYGIAWDEKQQHDIGEMSFNYVFNGDTALFDFRDKDYGVAFELPLIIIEKVFNLTDTREIYLSRHLITHLFFLLGAFCLFLLIDLLYKNKLLATVGFLLLILYPRVYAHSFFNTKDLPFLSMFIICFLLTAIAFKRKKVLPFLFLGMATGLLINLRLMGVLLFASVILFLVIDFVRNKKAETSRKSHFTLLGVFVFSAIITLYASWPFLWSAPIENFGLAFENMAKFRWEGTSLYYGEYVDGQNLSWEYSLVWFGITTPIFYMVAGAFGLVLLVIRFLKGPVSYLSNSLQRNNLLYLACFAGPFLAVIVLQSVLYDGWRQLYFVYPSLILLIIFGLHHLFHTKLKFIVLSLFGIVFCTVFYFMVANAPFQHVYFNQLVNTNTPNHLRQQFEMDYWGVSYRQALEYVLEDSDSDHIKVCVANAPGKANLRILPVDQRNRIELVATDADYFISAYRWHPADYVEFEDYESHSFVVQNNAIVSVFKFK